MVNLRAVNMHECAAERKQTEATLPRLERGEEQKKKASEEKQQQKNGYIVFSESPSGKLHLFCLYIFFSYHILKRFGLRIECVGVYVRVHSPKTF